MARKRKKLTFKKRVRNVEMSKQDIMTYRDIANKSY